MLFRQAAAPLASRTRKHASCSSTVRGGGKRRDTDYWLVVALIFFTINLTAASALS